MTINLRGVMATLLTPFDRQQALDKASLRRPVQFNTQRGIDGLYVSGSTGKAFAQNLPEHEQILEIIAEKTKGKIKLIAHVGCVSTAESQQLTASAKRYGFDAVPAVTLFYYPFSFEEHCDHYRAVTDLADGLSMVMCNIPTLSGVRLTLGQTNTLIMLPSVGTLKQTSDDLYQMEQIRREHPSLVSYNGYGKVFTSDLLMGTDGDIGSAYNIMGWCYQGIAKALKEGDIRTVQRLQTECNKVIDLLTKAGVLHSLKTVPHYMDVVSILLCRKPPGLVDERYLSGLKALAQQLIQEHG